MFESQTRLYRNELARLVNTLLRMTSAQRMTVARTVAPQTYAAAIRAVYQSQRVTVLPGDKVTIWCDGQEHTGLVFDAKQFSDPPAAPAWTLLLLMCDTGEWWQWSQSRMGGSLLKVYPGG